MINRILHSCAYIVAQPRIISFPPTRLINSIIYEHSCKILYIRTCYGCVMRIFKISSLGHLFGKPRYAEKLSRVTEYSISIEIRKQHLFSGKPSFENNILNLTFACLPVYAVISILKAKRNLTSYSYMYTFFLSVGERNIERDYS